MIARLIFITVALLAGADDEVGKINVTHPVPVVREERKRKLFIGAILQALPGVGKMVVPIILNILSTIDWGDLIKLLDLSEENAEKAELLIKKLLELPEAIDGLFKGDLDNINDVVETATALIELLTESKLVNNALKLPMKALRLIINLFGGKKKGGSATNTTNITTEDEKPLTLHDVIGTSLTVLRVLMEDEDEVNAVVDSILQNDDAADVISYLQPMMDFLKTKKDEGTLREFKPATNVMIAAMKIAEREGLSDDSEPKEVQFNQDLQDLKNSAASTPASTSTPKSTSTSTSVSTPAAAASLSRETQAEPDMNPIIIPAIVGVSLLLCTGFLAAGYVYRGRTKRAGALASSSASVLTSSLATVPSNANKSRSTTKSSRTTRSARLKRSRTSLTGTSASRSLANRSVASKGSSGSMMSQNSSRKLDRSSISSMSKSRRAQRSEDKSHRNKRGG